MGVCGEMRPKKNISPNTNQEKNNPDQEKRDTNNQTTKKKKYRSSIELRKNSQKKERKNEDKNSLIKKEIENKTKSIEKRDIISKNQNGIPVLPEEYIAFPKGEHYYKLTKDSNIGGGNSMEIISRLSEKIELFFSLNNICNPKNEHSFAISIINNKQIGIKTFLGNLDNATGKEIEYGKSFIIDFFLKGSK